MERNNEEQGNESIGNKKQKRVRLTAQERQEVLADLRACRSHLNKMKEQFGIIETTSKLLETSSSKRGREIHFDIQSVGEEIRELSCPRKRRMLEKAEEKD